MPRSACNVWVESEPVVLPESLPALGVDAAVDPVLEAESSKQSSEAVANAALACWLTNCWLA
jgi:hypothetical protein